jgi:hypothetical protein
MLDEVEKPVGQDLGFGPTGNQDHCCLPPPSENMNATIQFF